MAVLSREQYNALVAAVNIPFSHWPDYGQIAAKFPGLPSEAVISLLHRHDVEREKRKSGMHARGARGYADRYRAGVDILDICNACDFSPCWIMKLVLSQTLRVSLEAAHRLLRSPGAILDWDVNHADAVAPTLLHRLAADVHRCALADRCSSPYVSVAQRLAGLVYESKLEEDLQTAGVPFFTEQDMRQNGCERTPDALLQVPILLRGRPVNWIDSKAMFGDDVSHNEYALKQYSAYVNRFGPGAVIYWFGFVADLANANSDVLLTTSFSTADIVQLSGLDIEG